MALTLGVLAWRTAPLQVAAFEEPDGRHSPWPALLIGTAALAGLISALIGLMQVLAPQLLNGALGDWLEPTHLAGRAVGHLRQPNHLATVLLWGAVAWAVLHAQGRMGMAGAAAGLGLLMTALVLTGSRTGLLGISLLVIWAVVDRHLPKPTRVHLALTPVLASLGWWAAEHYSRVQGLAFGASAHLQATAGGDVSSSRFAIWRNTWSLIEQQPWTGVGWGNFNIAWTLSPMSGRPPAFFDHAHNLPLHLLAEWGFPLGGAACLVTVAVLALAARRAWAALPLSMGPQPRERKEDALCRRGALVMLGIVGLHSLLEYPLWYAYLGLPAALALLVCLGWDRPRRRVARWPALLCIVTGAAMLVGAAWAYRDYQTVRAIYEPQAGSGSLRDRIASGLRTTWFTDHAHYALATTVKPIPNQPWTATMTLAFERAPHVLLDPRLMMAWADALASRSGPDDRDRARHIAARLREFNSPSAANWLKACDDPESAPSQRFVCEAPERSWNWRDFGLR